MDPITGQRRFALEPDRIAWHAFTLGVIALLLAVLLVSVRSLGDPEADVGAPPPERATAPGDPLQEDAARRPIRAGSVGEAFRRAREPAVPRPAAPACAPGRCAAV